VKPKGSLETSNILRSTLDEGLDYKLSYQKGERSEEIGRMNLPSFDGRVESYNKWETEWAAFAEEEGLSGAMIDCRNSNMLDSSVFVVEEECVEEEEEAEEEE
jgi:hypothetical protein